MGRVNGAVVALKYCDVVMGVVDRKLLTILLGWASGRKDQIVYDWVAVRISRNIRIDLDFAVSKILRYASLSFALGVFALLVIAGPSAASKFGTSTVQTAAPRMFQDMPKNYFTIKVVPAYAEITTGVPLVIDVHEPSEFAEEHIRGVKNIPLGSLVKQIKVLPANRSKAILVYCKSGHRGAMGLTVLRMLGYENVRSIYGGIIRWKCRPSGKE